MNVQVSRHVFGADRGYRTLAASSDVTPEVRRELEAFTFGQTHDAGYLDSLGRVPAYWSRPLASGRRAITRVLNGEPDDQGRSTLLFITGVVDAREWLAGLCGEEPIVFANEEFCAWQPGTDLARVTIRIENRPARLTTPQQREKILSVLGALEGHNDDPRASLVVAEKELGPDDINLLTLLLPGDSRATFSYAMRSLSDGLPVRLNCLADCASRGKSRRRIVRWRPGMTYENWRYTSALAYFWKPGESPPWEFVANCKSFGQLHLGVSAGQAKQVSTLPPPAAKARNKPRRPFPTYALLIASLVVLVGITALFVGRKLLAKQRAESLLVEAKAFFDDDRVKTPLTRELCQKETLQEKAGKLASEIQEVGKRIDDEGLRSERDRLKQWNDEAKRRCAEYATIEKLLDDFNTWSPKLGLDAPEKLKKYPSAAEIERVESWKGRLQEQRQPAESLGDSYLSAIEEGLRRIEKFDAAVEELPGLYAGQLANLEEFFREKVPERLSDEVVERWNTKRTQLEKLGHRMGVGGEEQVADDLLTLRKRYAECEQEADRWASEITSLQKTFQEELGKAQSYIEEAELATPPLLAEDLADPWKIAVRARKALEKALSIWPARRDALEKQQVVDAWMDGASDITFDHFQERFDRAEAKWKQWRRVDNAPNGNDNGEENTDPRVVRDSFEEALKYWDQTPNETIIERKHKDEAWKLHDQARKRKYELEDAIKGNEPLSDNSNFAP